MAGQIDPIRDIKRMMADIEQKLPAGAPKVSQMLPAAPPIGGRASPEIRPEEILREPAKLLREVEAKLPVGAPKISEMVAKPPLAGEEREPKITGGGVEALPPDRGPKVVGG